mgnify:CR=1 FL=1
MNATQATDSRTSRFLELFDQSETGQFHELGIFRTARLVFNFGLNSTPRRKEIPVSLSLSATYDRVDGYQLAADVPLFLDSFGERRREDVWDVVRFFDDFEIWSSFGDGSSFLTVFLVSSEGFSRILDDILVLKYPNLSVNPREAQEKHERDFAELISNTPESILRQLQNEKSRVNAREINPFRIQTGSSRGPSRTYYCPRALLGL